MPELPEVETVVRSLAPLLRQRTVTSVWTSGFPLHLARPVDSAMLQRLLKGARIEHIRRRGKYIVIDVAGRASAVLLVHLGMTGRLLVNDTRTPRPAHTHVVLGLDHDKELRFIDPRRFGLVKVAEDIAALEELAEMGPEPLDELSAEMLAASLTSSRAPIKSFLLDQKRVAGLGNIYVCEALFLIGVHPCKPASKLRRRASEMLEAIRQVLQLGLENRGTTLRDYVDATGSKGGNQSALQVYGRAGKPCLRCSTLVRRRLDAGRSSFYCPRCQKR